MNHLESWENQKLVIEIPINKSIVKNINMLITYIRAYLNGLLQKKQRKLLIRTTIKIIEYLKNNYRIKTKNCWISMLKMNAKSCNHNQKYLNMVLVYMY